MTQPSLFGGDDEQLSFEDAFKTAWNTAAPAPTLATGAPISAAHGEFETINILDDVDNTMEADPNPGGVASDITIVPTSSINPARPRTLAAGYNHKTKTLTVIFRIEDNDGYHGEPYNYYDVPNIQWQNFKRARSKGVFIYTYLDSHPRGFATGAENWNFDAENVQGEDNTGSRESKRGRGYRSGNLGGTSRLRSRTASLDDAVSAYWANKGKS